MDSLSIHGFGIQGKFWEHNPANNEYHMHIECCGYRIILLFTFMLKIVFWKAGLGRKPYVNKKKMLIHQLKLIFEGQK